VLFKLDYTKQGKPIRMLVEMFTPKHVKKMVEFADSQQVCGSLLVGVLQKQRYVDLNKIYIYISIQCLVLSFTDCRVKTLVFLL